MIPKALVAASLRPFILSILRRGPSYGYAIMERVHELSDGEMTWTDGTVYPVLHRLETEDLVESFWRESDVGRDRKYYRLTPKGERAFEAEKSHWQSVHEMLVALWETPPEAGSGSPLPAAG